jgi:hypothetical protein
MPNLPSYMISVLSAFLPLFSAPTYRNFLLLFGGHILCKGRRTVTNILKQVGLRHVKNFSKFHEFFSKAKWSPVQGAKILFLRLAALSSLEILISVDSTVERRKGPKIKGLGIQRDAVRSTKSKKVLVPGLHWLVFAVHMRLPWSNRPWALPFFTILMPPEEPLKTSLNQHDLSKSKKHKTMIQWTCQVVKLLRRLVGPSKKIIIVADSAFATYALANTCIDCNVKLISRMRLDARTFEFPPADKGRKRPRLVGKRLPTFKSMLKDAGMVWQPIDVIWYGGATKKLEHLSGSCLWYGYGIRPVPIQWILTRGPNDDTNGTVIFTTDLTMPITSVIENFVYRWQIEVTFEEARAHLGLETQRQWSDGAIDKITPCILASFSIINLIALECVAAGREIPIQTCSWYKKTHVTFSDIMTFLRTEILGERCSSKFTENTDLWNFELQKIIDELAVA